MTKSKKSKGAAGGTGHALSTTVGMVNHDPTRFRAPGYSFGTRPEERQQRGNPGPQYTLQTGLTPRGTGHCPSFSITGRPRRTVWDSMVSRGPAPGAYTLPSPHLPGEKAAPMHSFGFPHRAARRETLPAPNTYTLPPTLGARAPDLRSGPASSLHSRGPASKGFAHDLAKTPGPAQYSPGDLTATRKRAPATTLKSRTKLPALSTSTPGPAAYDPSNLEKVSKSSPRVTLRVRYSDSLRPPLFMMADVRH